jgi:hypothetical protein
MCLAAAPPLLCNAQAPSLKLRQIGPEMFPRGQERAVWRKERWTCLFFFFQSCNVESGKNSFVSLDRVMTIRGFAKPSVVDDSLVTAQQSAAPPPVCSPSLHLLATEPPPPPPLLLHEQSARFYIYAQHEHAVCTTESSHLAV